MNEERYSGRHLPEFMCRRQTEWRIKWNNQPLPLKKLARVHFHASCTVYIGEHTYKYIACAIRRSPSSLPRHRSGRRAKRRHLRRSFSLQVSSQKHWSSRGGGLGGTQPFRSSLAPKPPRLAPVGCFRLSGVVKDASS